MRGAAKKALCRSGGVARRVYEGVLSAGAPREDGWVSVCPIKAEELLAYDAGAGCLAIGAYVAGEVDGALCDLGASYGVLAGACRRYALELEEVSAESWVEAADIVAMEIALMNGEPEMVWTDLPEELLYLIE